MSKLIACFDCHGTGEFFEGAWMNSNPSSYSDYEEIWCECKRCKTKGYLDAGDLLRFIQESPRKNLEWLFENYRNYRFDKDYNEIDFADLV